MGHKRNWGISRQDEDAPVVFASLDQDFDEDFNHQLLTSETLDHVYQDNRSFETRCWFYP